MVRIFNAYRREYQSQQTLLILSGEAERQLNGRLQEISVSALTNRHRQHSRIFSLLHNAGQQQRRILRHQKPEQQSIVKYSGRKHRTICAVHRAASMLLASLATCLPHADARAQPVVHDYTVTIDYSMTNLWVEARFRHPVESVTARSRDAGKFLVDVRGCDSTSNIRLRNRRMLLPEDGITCLNYTVDLGRAAKENRQNRTLSAQNIVVSPSIWLWRPELAGSTELHLQFRLPEGTSVSVPWQPVDSEEHRFLLRDSPESSNAPAAFGSFDYRELAVPGSTLRVALLRSEQEKDAAGIFDWVRATATDVSLAYGRFPSPMPQVLIIPVGNSRERSSGAVPFGQVIRDGGETVLLYINETEPQSAFLEDWTATHEFSHLLLPYIDRRHKWISEGFAQYYQNILLARSGAYEEQHAWQKIYDGLERGRLSRPELSPNEAAEGGVRTGLMKIYWSGAAIALIADVGLRELSGGRESLDTVLEQLQTCCLPSDHVWSGPELFAQMDALTDFPVFLSLYRRYADTAGFPDTANVLERLGIQVSDSKVKVRKNNIRLAITAPDAEASRQREKLAAN